MEHFQAKTKIAEKKKACKSERGFFSHIFHSSSINFRKISQMNLISYVIWRLAIEFIKSIYMIYALACAVLSKENGQHFSNIYERYCLENEKSGNLIANIRSLAF